MSGAKKVKSLSLACRHHHASYTVVIHCVVSHSERVPSLYPVRKNQEKGPVLC